MTMTLSSATASAKAAKAELTAPVASNHGGLDSMPTPAQSHNAANNGSRVPPKSAPQAGSSKNPLASNQPRQNATPRSATPASQNDPVSHPGRDQAEPATDEAQSGAPLFAQLLQLTDPLVLDPQSSATDSGADGAADAAADPAAAAVTAANANAATLVPAMFNALQVNAAQQAAPAASADGAAPVRADAVGATSTLNSAVTRLNLSAASVAVTAPAPAPAGTSQTIYAMANSAAQGARVQQPLPDAAAAAPVSATPVSAVPVATPQNIYAMANNAALGAQVQQSLSDAPAPTAAAAPATAANATLAQVAAPLPTAAGAVFTPALPRVTPRSADAATADTPDLGSATSALAATAKDDGLPRSSAPAPAPVGNSVGFSQNTPAATPAAAVVKLAGAPDQWQQPLRDALGDRLQVQLQRNSDHAVIRLEPPNMGSIEISIRHSAGSLQVNLSANHSEVLRQLNTIGDSVRQDLSTRQYADVSVTVSSSRAQAQADSGGRNGQQREQEEGRTPGRALSDDDTTTFAMTSERE
ncbi:MULTISPECIES: flagellar hook-length control protein FliK [unclassified Duganella]|uniref:flagellar hook-length control protein FliK n=1 Tax=unclassified Duganella TaxID=2636909 RepID=UPI000E35152C|nr:MULTISPECIES: flagellar hook-length control protein FliK [unclassified Duganella]RFP18986.1 flagellar hook-length control protein FliK [Duganella sp. BJB475]RFP35648.1 flagellar hook-length control protein FliK [Duganella sp. BJB476]